MKIGIIGAENSHTANIAKIINVRKLLKGFTVDYVWGEKREFALKAAEAGNIPNIVSKPIDMLGKIDAVVVDHRHAKYHLPAVEPFMEAGIPTFVDKPFCYDPKEGLKFLAKAQKLGTPVTSYSHMTLRKSFVAFVKSLKAGKFGQVNAASTCGPADIKSKYGGVFFYGIHQVDMALTAFGHDVQSVSMQRSGDNAVGQLLYPSGLIVSIFLIKDYAGDFSFSLCTDKGPHSQTFENDEVPHLTGIQRFCKMFKTGKEPLSHEQIIKPIQVLEGFEKSIANAGKVTKIK